MISTTILGKAYDSTDYRQISNSSPEVTELRTKNLHSLPTSITIGNAQIPFKKSVKNLGFTLAVILI